MLPEFIFLGGVEDEDAVWVTILVHPWEDYQDQCVCQS